MELLTNENVLLKDKIDLLYKAIRLDYDKIVNLKEEIRLLKKQIQLQHH